MKRSLVILLACALAAFGLLNCKKDNNVLGVNVQPANDALSASYDNKTPVYAYTKLFDSTGSTNSSIKYLGVNDDPYFGHTEAGIYMNVNMNVSNLDFRPKPLIDSAELVLAVDITNSIGNLSSPTPITYSVYAIDSILYSTRLYYTSNMRYHRQSDLLKVSTSTYTLLNGVNVIRIPVDTAFASKILRDTVNLVNDNAFQSVYKGFYVACANQPGTEGVIYKCNLDDAQSGFFVKYYTGGAALPENKRSFRFAFNGSSALRYNTIKYDYTNAAQSLKAQLQGDTTKGSDDLFLKGMGSTKIKIMMPTLKSYSDSFKIAVNRAELIVNVDPAFNGGAGLYNYPTKLSLLPIDSAGKENYAFDQTNATDLARYDGGYDSENKRYVFNIARHVQAILNGVRKNYGFYLVMADPQPPYTVSRDNFIERVVLYGSGRGDMRPVFNFSYVKFPKD